MTLFKGLFTFGGLQYFQDYNENSQLPLRIFPILASIALGLIITRRLLMKYLLHQKPILLLLLLIISSTRPWQLQNPSFKVRIHLSCCPGMSWWIRVASLYRQGTISIGTRYTLSVLPYEIFPDCQIFSSFEFKQLILVLEIVIIS